MIYRHNRDGPPYSLGDARQLLRQAFESAAELRRDCDILPRIAPDGTSECPFAEDLYYQKERTVQFVREDLQRLREYAEAALSEAAKSRKGLSTVAHERDNLHHEAAQRHFHEAEMKIKNQVRKHQQMHADLLEAICEVEATLREAKAKAFPGREPRGPFGETIQHEPPKPKPLEDIMRDYSKDEIARIRRVSEGLDEAIQ